METSYQTYSSPLGSTLHPLLHGISKTVQTEISSTSEYLKAESMKTTNQNTSTLLEISEKGIVAEFALADKYNLLIIENQEILFFE